VVTMEEKGSGQGSVISPLLANVYLHYVIFRLPRRADQQSGIICVPLPRCGPLAPATMPAQPAGVPGVGADGETGRRISPEAPCPASLAERAVCRQTPAVGAVCGNSARTDLCGGRSAMGVPTANTADRS
jgi:hypothetical protein